MSYLEKEIGEEGKEAIIDTAIEGELFGSNKILFTGLSQSGKTSIIQVIFEGKPPVATVDLRPTVRFTRKQHALNGFSYLVVDVGGQVAYLDEVFDVLNETIFKNLGYLFYVVDIAEPEKFYQSREYFARALSSVEQFSKKAKIFVLAHKMDLIPKAERERKIAEFLEIFYLVNLDNVELHQTSIFEDSIYKVMHKILLDEEYEELT
jgi:Ras-related GTP-binding protein A/B